MVLNSTIATCTNFTLLLILIFSGSRNTWFEFLLQRVESLSWPYYQRLFSIFFFFVKSLVYWQFLIPSFQFTCHSYGRWMLYAPVQHDIYWSSLLTLLYSQVPRESLVFVIPAFGGVVSWEGEGAPINESDQSINYQVCHYNTCADTNFCI